MAICTCFAQVAGASSPQMRIGDAARARAAAPTSKRERGEDCALARADRSPVDDERPEDADAHGSALSSRAIEGVNDPLGGRIPNGYRSAAPTDTTARHARPMDTTHTTRIARSAAAAALVAAALAGCASQASAPVEPVEEPAAAVEPRQLVPNDIDPRGLHGPLASLPHTPTHQRMPVINDVDPRGLHGVPNAGTALSAAEAGTSAPPTISAPINDVDPRGLHGRTSATR